MTRWAIHPGRSDRLGAWPTRQMTPDGTMQDGVNFALFSAHANDVELCLFDEGQEIRLRLPERSGDIWHGFVPGVLVGAQYGFRVTGPWAPDLGHRFDANKFLLDPYARQISAPLRWDPLMTGRMAVTPGQSRSQGMGEATLDSAPAMPRAIVCEDARYTGTRPHRRLSEMILYEAHPKGVTITHPEVPEPLRGRFAGLASAPFIGHLQSLGVTALELLPCAAFIDDRFLVERGLSNYWGYQPICPFAPDPRYGSPDEFRDMVSALHAAGIEVIVDVVFNHTGEGDAAGPTVAMRGIDNQSYYRLTGPARGYVDDTGTGNTLNTAHPAVLRLVMDCLRHWVENLGVDGFRFDLAATLGRDGSGAFRPDAALIAAMMQDPLLSSVRMIAEPWDIGPGGYQLGGFPWPFLEWNDRYRDGVRRFWRCDGGQMAELGRRISGSAEVFDLNGRNAAASVNFLTAHDGFTLQDLVSYNAKNNRANGEDNRDGHDVNYSAALTDPEARARRKRAMLATLMISQGTPMLLAGDEIGNSQGGNNNAYAQDNEIGWVNWGGADRALADFVGRMAAIRRANPVLRQQRFLHAKIRRQDGMRDLIWRLPTGEEPTPQDWLNPDARCLCVEIRGAAEGPEGAAARTAVFAVLNAGDTTEVRLPDGHWRFLVDSAAPARPESDFRADTTCVEAQSVQLFSRPIIGPALREQR